MENYAEFIVLCEDTQHSVFIRRYLINCGVPKHKIRILPVPAGNGSGEQYVREHFADQVTAIRNKNSHSPVGVKLITMIDSDRKSFKERKIEVESNLNPSRTNQEPIAIFVPEKNIQTWLYWLEGNDVNNDDDYKNKYNSEYAKKCEQCVKKLKSEICTKGVPGDTPESLKDACLEWQRVRP